ncbi:MAG: T9SS type A sorting domain-containing protein [Spiribacter salinus]|uniref:T9SS type A sorting domain-containing protein n=1 Tax=Spiribacter salinus TaxID=1335746 RepID=A0A540V0K2_9GAMM|nr:MAG: T9SS type A sorting domain-containing protein [Spiribacter salinus]
MATDRLPRDLTHFLRTHFFRWPACLTRTGLTRVCRFVVPERQAVRIVLYGMLGRQVDTDAEGRTEAQFDVSNLASGTYLLKMQTEYGPVDTQRVTVVR